MKTKFLILILLVAIPVLSFSQIKDTITKFDTVIPDKHCAIRTFSYNVESFITIGDKAKLSSNNIISFTLGTITQVDDTTFKVLATQKGKGYLRINKYIYKIEVKDPPVVTVTLNGPKYNWKENEWFRKISKNEIKRISEIKVFEDGQECKEVLAFYFIYKNNKGESIRKEFKGDTIPQEVKEELFQMKAGDFFEISAIWMSKDLAAADTWPIRFQIIESDVDEIIRNKVNYDLKSKKLDILRTDLRIKITGNPSPANIQTVKDVVADLDTLLESIDVKIVENRPTLTICFDTTYITGEVKRIFFFPYISNQKIHLNSKIQPEWIQTTNIWGAIIDRLVVTNTYFRIPDGAFSQTSDSCSIFNWRTKPGMTNLDRLILKRLFSKDGERKITESATVKMGFSEKNNNILIIAIICGVLAFLFFELNRYYGFSLWLKRMKNRFFKKVIESFFIAQLPILASLLFFLVADNDNFVQEHLDKIVSYEIYFCLFAIILGSLLLLLDSSLKKIKQVWLKLTMDFIFTFIMVVLTYQIILLFIRPMLIDFSLIEWQYFLVPFCIMLFRFIMTYEENKISGLLQEKELELVKQKELKLKSDLNALQSRINPHFLYNSLNSIASLAHIDSDRTEKMALALSKLFRYNINREEDYSATLSSEIEMVKIYLEIEKTRFEDKLEYKINVDEKLNDFEIPKFILQPIVENAVKHGISKITEKGLIEISVSEENKNVMIEIYDNGPPFPDDLLSGYGLQNVHDKMKILYKKKFNFEFINIPKKHIKLTLQK